jgi:hypothetical protein
MEISKQSQKGGNDCTNIQAHTVNIIGVTREQAEAIALRVFEENAYRLTDIAREIFDERAKEFRQDLVRELYTRNPSALNSMIDPDMQYGVFRAQRDYARSGDKDLLEMLVSLLIERASEDKRSLLQIVLNECLSVVPKLTAGQLDALSNIFLVRWRRWFAFKDWTELRGFIDGMLTIFIPNLPRDKISYAQLQYLGCVVLPSMLGRRDKDLVYLYMRVYEELLSSGMEMEERKSRSEHEDAENVVERGVHDQPIFHMNAKDKSSFDDLFSGKRRCVPWGASFNHKINADQVRKLLVTANENMASLLETWRASVIADCKLTPVGIALAIANIARKTKANIELSFWIETEDEDFQ